MCTAARQKETLATVSEAIAQADAALAYLANLAADDLAVTEQAECLIGLERAASRLLAARARVLRSFSARHGYEDDGHASARVWLTWRTRITKAAATTAIRWARRLTDHPAVRTALASGAVSVSWARQVCAWTEALPAEHQSRADAILLGAAAGGATLADLAGLAEQIRRATARPDRDGDGFEDRWLRLSPHWRGMTKLDGELTPQASAALAAVLNALGKKAGPEDTRSQAQRDHDALEEACRRLIASGCLPERAGQPTQIQLQMTLDQLLGHVARQRWPDSPMQQTPAAGSESRPGESDWPNYGPSTPGTSTPGTSTPGTSDPDAPGQPGTPAQPDAPGQPGTPAQPDAPAQPGSAPTGRSARSEWLGPGLPAAAPGDECDATIVPIVTGHIDPTALDQLIQAWLAHRNDLTNGDTAQTSADSGTSSGADLTADQVASQVADRAAGNSPGNQPVGPRPPNRPRLGPPGDFGPPGDGGDIGNDGDPGQTTPRPPYRRTPDPASDPTMTSDANSARLAREPARYAAANPGYAAEGLCPSRAGLDLTRDTAVRQAVDLLSGPAGLAAWLRQEALDGPAASISLPLDIGTATDTIPAHLRRAVATRDRGCRFPGCDQPQSACHPHHIVPRAEHGPTSLANLISLCSFHHLIAVHRWGWRIVLHGSGAVTAFSPDGRRTATDQGPHRQAA